MVSYSLSLTIESPRPNLSTLSLSHVIYLKKMKRSTVPDKRTVSRTASTESSNSLRPSTTAKSKSAARRRNKKRPRGNASSVSSSKANTCMIISLIVAVVVFVLADVSYFYSIQATPSIQRENHPVADKRHTQQQSPTSTAAKNVTATYGKIPVANSKNRNKDKRDLSDKGPIVEILHQAGVDVNDLDDDTIQALPTWSQIQRLFGPKPIFYGLETCEAFRESTDPTMKFLAVAGTFNTGTNLLAELLIQNCQITERMQVQGNESKGMRWQVPWGKHQPAWRRGKHVTDKQVPQENALPFVCIRDPYMWMQSMCKHRYAAHWDSAKDHCPGLIATAEDKRNSRALGNNTTIPVSIAYSKKENLYVNHDSLVHHWNEWYQLYFNATFPRVLVRFEDLLFYGKEVTETLCSCGGGVPREDRKFPHFVHVMESAKLGTHAHGKQKTNLVGALIKYGNHDHRVDGMNGEDLDFAAKILDPTLMSTFGYSNP